MTFSRWSRGRETRYTCLPGTGFAVDHRGDMVEPDGRYHRRIDRLLADAAIAAERGIECRRMSFSGFGTRSGHPNGIRVEGGRVLKYQVVRDGVGDPVGTQKVDVTEEARRALARLGPKPLEAEESVHGPTGISG